MPSEYPHHPDTNNLFENNRAWASRMTDKDADYFKRLSTLQAPDYLWIGCADSRVPANEIVGLLPGELFVHRNIANVVVHTDLNCLSVLQYAVQVLKVKHVIVCGHYGCGGVQAATESKRFGLIDNWLRHIQDVAHSHQSQLDQIPDAKARVNRLCELNVVEQVVNVCRTTAIQDAWEQGQDVAVHGWVYSLNDGLINDLKMTATSNDSMTARYVEATAAPVDHQDLATAA